MMSWIVQPCAGLIEPSVAPEFYVDGIGGIEMMNGVVRVYLMAEQMPLEAGSDGAHKIVQVKIVGPLLNIPQVIGQLAQCLWRPAVEIERHPPPRGRTPYLVP